MAGSVSGGSVESEVAVAARDVLARGEPTVLTYGITDEQAGSVGLPFGGEIDVGIERVALSELERLAEESAPNRLVVFGAVDIAEALVAGPGARVGDRRRRPASDLRDPGANRERGRAARRMAGGGAGEVVLDEQSAVVVLAHEERLDVPALLGALRSEAFYVGALGSRRTQERRRERLLAEGLSEAEVRIDLSGPTGLDLRSRDACRDRPIRFSPRSSRCARAAPEDG